MGKRKGRLLFAAAFIAIVLLMLLLNIHTPLMMDDYDYSFSWSTGERLAGIGDILASQAAHYMLWGGRSVTHFLAQLFLYWGKPVFNVANALMYGLLLLEILALSGRKTDALRLMTAHALLFFLVPFFGVAFLWLDGACNYLWGTVLALLPLLIAQSEREGGFFDGGWEKGALALPICFLAGWTNENTACGVLAALVLLLMWDLYQKRRIRGWRAAALVFEALGTAVLLLAPGNFTRAAEEASSGLVMELIYRFAVTTYCALRYAGVIALLAAAALLLFRKKKTALNAQRLLVLFAAAFLSTYALVGSPQISDRSFTGVIALSVALLLGLLPEKEVKLSHLALAAVICAIGGAFAAKDVVSHERAWMTEVKKIEAAAAQGEEDVAVSSVPSVSRYTMGVLLEESFDSWPNSTLSKYYEIRINGQ